MSLNSDLPLHQSPPSSPSWIVSRKRLYSDLTFAESSPTKTSRKIELQVAFGVHGHDTCHVVISTVASDSNYCTYPSCHATLTVNRTLQTLPATSVDWTSLDSSLACKRGIPVLRRVNELRLPVYSSWLV